MIPEAFFHTKNGLLRRCATKKLRNSGGVAHIADFVRSGILPCVTLKTVTVTSGEIVG